MSNKDIISKYDGMSLVQKLNAVRELVGVVKKDGKVAFKSTNYNYQRAEDIELAVREACIEVGVLVLPINIQWINDNGNIVTVDITYRFINAENKDDYIDCHMLGMGQDSGDKRIYKAETGAFKYLLKQSFQIPSEDSDPDLIPSQAYTVPKTTSDGKLNWKDFVPKNGKYAGQRLEDIAQTKEGLGYIKWASTKAGEFQPFCLEALKELNND